MHRLLSSILLIFACCLVSFRSVSAQSYTESVIYSFCSQGGSSCTDGSAPSGGLIQASDGNFYGTTGSGGSAGKGTIFTLSPSGTLTTLHNFCAVTGCLDGSVPAGIIQGGDGNIYGVTSMGGANLSQCDGAGCGTVFKMSLSGDFHSLYSFCTQSDCSDGKYPNATLIQGSDGNYYGTTSETIFKITSTGSLTTVSSNTDLYAGGLLQGADGNFYGVTQEGGDFTNCSDTGCGTIFSLTPSGNLTTIYEFPQGYPDTTLVQGSDGSLYGTFPASSGSGSVFKITYSGSLTPIYNFCSQAVDGDCTDGYAPNPLWPGSDGNLYGNTSMGGLANHQLCDGEGCGTIFEVTPSAKFSSIYSFCGQSGSPCVDSQYPAATLVQGADGSLYGVGGGGTNVLCDNGDAGCGAIFKVGALPSLPAPVELNLSKSTIEVGESTTLSWQVFNAFSTTMQQCYAFLPVDSSGAGTWVGIQSGAVSGGIFQGSASIQPTVDGVYTYALTCGGVESGSVILRVGSGKAATSTSLQAPTSITLDSVGKLIAATITQQNIAPLTGSITFSYGSLVLGTVDLTSGSASLNVTAQGIPTGTYRITATYSGDANYAGSVGAANVTVLGFATETTLSVSSAELTQGQQGTLSATVGRTSVGGTPSGNVTFFYGTTVLGTAKLNGDKASLVVTTSGSIPPGTYSLSAKYDGDTTDQASTSAPASVKIIAATQTSLIVSPTIVPKNSATKMTASVKREYGTGVPTGSVTFSVGNYVLGMETLDDTGTAVVNASSVGIPPGVYPVVATYSGDSADSKSESSIVNVTVQ